MNMTDLLVVGIFVSFLIGYTVGCAIGIKRGKEINIQPIRPKGEWINCDPVCPCCGEDKFKGLEADIWSDWKPNYCPNCGADMREVNPYDK